MPQSRVHSSSIREDDSINMLGFRSGRLLVISRAGTENKRAMWTCLCDCGNTAIRSGKYLRKREVKSCGCLKRQPFEENQRIKHGKARGKIIDPALRSYYAMKARCCSESCSAWKKYGGRGIKVCVRWLESSTNFLTDMGPRPPGTSLDRIDNSKGYSPGNCRWADASTQATNTRRSRWLVYKGECRTLSQWARFLGYSVPGLHSRLNRMPKAKALIHKPQSVTYTYNYANIRHRRE